MNSKQTTYRAMTFLRILILFAVALMANVLLGGMKPAHAAFPGSAGNIAFMTDRGGNFDIYRTSADGAWSALLVGYPSYISDDPAWSSDGKRIAYSYGTGSHRGINVINAAGTEIWAFPASFDNVDSCPAFYPGKNKIVFESNRSGGGDLYSIAFNEYGNITSLTRLTTRASEETMPSVSPDGKKIAFASDRDGDMDIYVMNAGSPESATNKPVKLTKNSVEDTSPDWSPSGKKIVLQSYRSGSLQDILLMNADGTNQTDLTGKVSAINDISPSFSPDGKKIAYASNRGGTDFDIWRMNPDGSNPVNLTSNSPGLDWNPSWQPIP